MTSSEDGCLSNIYIDIDSIDDCPLPGLITKLRRIIHDITIIRDNRISEDTTQDRNRVSGTSQEASSAHDR